MTVENLIHMTQLIIGDIHGCYDELQQLLDKSGISDDDEIIAIGDLFDRGPKPREVFRFFRDTPRCQGDQWATTSISISAPIQANCHHDFLFC